MLRVQTPPELQIPPAQIVEDTLGANTHCPLVHVPGALKHSPGAVPQLTFKHGSEKKILSYKRYMYKRRRKLWCWEKTFVCLKIKITFNSERECENS